MRTKIQSPRRCFSAKAPSLQLGIDDDGGPPIFRHCALSFSGARFGRGSWEFPCGASLPFVSVLVFSPPFLPPDKARISRRQPFCARTPALRKLKPARQPPGEPHHQKRRSAWRLRRRASAHPPHLRPNARPPSPP